MKNFTLEDMSSFAYFYHNGFTNKERPSDPTDAIPIWRYANSNNK